MIPAPFSYRRADSVAEALDLITEYGDDGKFLAGGHSLLPLMKLRLAMPEVLIDLGPVRELSYIREEDGHIAITGSHPVTTDGGTMSFSHAGTNPQMMQRAIRGVQQIRGEAGPLQVPDAQVALCSGGGAGALFNAVLLLGDHTP